MDPEKHVSRKAPKKTKEQKRIDTEREENKKKHKGEAIMKKAPVIVDSKQDEDKSKSSKSRKEQEFYRRQARDKEELNPRMSALRARVAQRSNGLMFEVAPQTRATHEQSQMSTTRSIHDASIQDQEKQKMRKLDESCIRIPGTANVNKGGRSNNRRVFLEAFRQEVSRQQEGKAKRQKHSHEATIRNSNGKDPQQYEQSVPKPGSERTSIVAAGSMHMRISKGELHAINNILNA